MKYITVITGLLILFIACNVSAQQFRLIRSLDTHDVVTSPIRRTVEDTKDVTSTRYSHTGNMRIVDGFVTFNTLRCFDNECIRDNSTRQIILVTPDGGAVAIEDPGQLFGAKLIRILSTSPTVILMDTFADGTVLITEWENTN